MKSKKRQLEQAKLSRNPEYLETIRLLVHMSVNPDWRLWAEQYASNEVEFDDQGQSRFTVAAMLSHALKENDLQNVRKNFRAAAV